MTDEIAIHCPTQQDWDDVTDHLGYQWITARWDRHKENTVITESTQSYCTINTAIRKGYTLTSAKEYMSYYDTTKAPAITMVWQPPSPRRLSTGWKVVIAIGLSASLMWLFYFLHLSRI